MSINISPHRVNSIAITSFNNAIKRSNLLRARARRNEAATSSLRKFPIRTITVPSITREGAISLSQLSLLRRRQLLLVVRIKRRTLNPLDAAQGCELFSRERATH